MKNLKDIVVLYHAKCPDGFGSAYAAWKKFGDNASYLPVTTQAELPDGLTGKEIYILDYSFPKDTLEALRAGNAKVLVIDHHKSAEDAVTSFPDNIFDVTRSGATLSWKHFNPTRPVPRLLNYIEDNDLWKFELPNSKHIGAFIDQLDFDFEEWNTLAINFENGERLLAIADKGKLVLGQKRIHMEELLTYAEKVEFDGYEVFAVNCGRPYRSEIGHLLAQRSGTFGIVWYHYEGVFHFSMRSVRDFDVSVIAQKYGGGGHKNAASIRFEKFEDVPMKFL